MNIEMNETKEETFITNVTIINPRPFPVPIPSKYHCIFKGRDSVSYGRHHFRFPITHMDYKRLVSSLQSDYAGVLRVDFGLCGDTDEV